MSSGVSLTFLVDVFNFVEKLNAVLKDRKKIDIRIDLNSSFYYCLQLILNKNFHEEINEFDDREINL